MSNKIMSTRQFILLCSGFYIFINFAVLLWSIIDPLGFWSIIWYSSLLIIITIVFFLLWNILDEFIMIRKTSRVYNEIFLYLFLTLFGVIVYFGPVLAVSWSLKDRYELINQSEYYFSEGRYDDAITSANKAFHNAMIVKPQTSQFLVMQYAYENTVTYKKIKDNNKYQAIINLAYCLQAKGIEKDKSEALYKESIKLSKTKFPDNPEYLLFPVLGCFKLYMSAGDTPKSDSCYLELSNILTNLNQNDVYYKSQSMVLYSIYAEKNGDIGRAIALRREALAVVESSNINLEKSQTYAAILIKVASDCFITNRLKDAEHYLNICGNILEGKEEKVIYRDYLFVKAQFYELKGNLIVSENYYKKSLSSVLSKSGGSDSEIAFHKFSLATFYFRYHNYKLAADLYDSSLLLAEKSNLNKVQYYDILLGSTISDFKLQKLSSALNKAKQIESYLFDQFENNYLFLPEEEKESYIAKIEKQISLLNLIHISEGDSLQICNLYNNILATKAIALESNQITRSLISQNKKSDLYQNFIKLSARKDILNGMKFSGQKIVLELTRSFDSLRNAEVALLKEVAELSDFKNLKINSVNWRDVQSALSKGQVAIEFIHVPVDPSQQHANKRYYALIVKPGSKKPSIIKLFDESDVEKIMDKVGKSEERINKIYTGDSFDSLYNLIWNPLTQEIAGSSKVFASLSGILNRISIPVLTINEKYNVEILNCTRKLAFSGLKNIKVKNNNATLYGDIDFNSSINDPANSHKYSNIDTLSVIVSRSGFKPLPGTKTEIDGIAKILSDNDYHPRKLIKANATKESFRNLSKQKPDIIHLATHGFYFPPDQSFRLYDFLSVQTEQMDLLSNPLFRSGLLFAGANHAKSNLNPDNGILTSYEISKLDLSGIYLIVLSACETGLGDIKGGEGVYGLQRAFKLAGVESLVISLWKVPDEETSILMQKFYSFYSKGYSEQESLKNAQIYMRDKLKKAPYFWGAFQVVK